MSLCPWDSPGKNTGVGWHFLLQKELFATPWTVAYQVPTSMEFSRQEYWSGLPFPSPSILLANCNYLMWYYQRYSTRYVRSSDSITGSLCSFINFSLDAPTWASGNHLLNYSFYEFFFFFFRKSQVILCNIFLPLFGLFYLACCFSCPIQDIAKSPGENGWVGQRTGSLWNPIPCSVLMTRILPR